MICPDCHVVYADDARHTCVSYTDKPIKVQYFHPDYAYEVKVSNNNTKGEKRVTVHVRSDSSPEEAQKLADKLYKDGLGS